jgi:2-succinyl-5-enolpyruvyl-6-hydroxy-3-cyclohexene-1-carboxylate synthase
MALPHTLDFRNTNTLWCSVLAETLVREGVTVAVTSPGSRSTPLTMALARHPQMEAIPVLDERSAAFFALGIAKRTRKPVALVCTSGTAAANYLPAIVEASESGAPLIVLTADRPPEMRECSSGQTIDQQKLYGGYVAFYHELCVPEATLPRLRYLRQTVVQAVARACALQAGPVHLNCPFRDPLVPVEDAAVASLRDCLDETFFVAPPHDLLASSASLDVTGWPACGAIVAGPDAVSDSAAYAKVVAQVAKSLGWPVLADALSPARRKQEEVGSIVTAYDAILRDTGLGQSLRPERILCLGGWPTSKNLRSWIEQCDAEIVIVGPTAKNRDALHGRTRHLAASVEALSIRGSIAGDAAYRDKWQDAESRARQCIDVALTAESELFEPKAAWLLAQHLPERTAMCVANSMPVRDLEYFWPATTRGLDVYFNRGANGIDGTLSTAFGVAHGGRPTVLLTGDLSFLHDTNGLLLRPALRGSLTIVLIDNRGGGIFEHLPVAQYDPPFERYFATPQDVDFAALCAAHRVEFVPVKSWAQFTGLIETLPERGVRVLALRTDRKLDAAQRKRLLAEAGRAE